MGDPDIYVEQQSDIIFAEELDGNGNPFTLEGTVNRNNINFTISGPGITPGIGPATTTYTGTLNNNKITGTFSGQASWIYDDGQGNFITETATWTGNFTVTILRPVLLVHGIWSGPGVWQESGVHDLLAENGFTPYEIKFSPSNASIEYQGAVISNLMKQIMDANPEATVDIVAHSMGGLASRWYLTHRELWPKDTNGNPRHGVRKFITLGTPHLGTDVHLLHPKLADWIEWKNREGNIYYGGLPDTFHFYKWSPGLAEMTAIWKQPAKWLGKSPLLTIEHELTTVLENTMQWPVQEWAQLNTLFPQISRKLIFTNHEQYYDNMITILNAGKSRSSLLETLIISDHPTDISYYFIYGTNKVMEEHFDLVGFPLTVHITGPYGDGVVHQKSATADPAASGKDAFQFPNCKRKSVFSYHAALPEVGKGLILKYLRE